MIDFPAWHCSVISICLGYYDEGGMPLSVSRDAACRSPNEKNKTRKLIFKGKYFFPSKRQSDIESTSLLTLVSINWSSNRGNVHLQTRSDKAIPTWPYFQCQTLSYQIVHSIGSNVLYLCCNCDCVVCTAIVTVSSYCSITFLILMLKQLCCYGGRKWPYFLCASAFNLCRISF